MKDRVTVTIDTGNAAFDGANYGPEVARILREAATKVDEFSEGFMSGDVLPLHDLNGNRVGQVKFS